MTNKEAIETIKIALAEVEWEYPMDYAAAFETAIEALEKQTPKKPAEEFETHALHDVNGNYIEQIDITSFRCPTCKCVISSGEISKEDCIGINYCDICGQAILWED